MECSGLVDMGPESRSAARATSSDAPEPGLDHPHQGYWAVSIGGRQLYIKQEALSQSVIAHLEEWRPKDNDPTLGNPNNGRLRELILEELKPFIAGTIEQPEPKKVLERTSAFQAIVSDEDLARARADHQTTCILFQQRILMNAAMKYNKERNVKVEKDPKTGVAKTVSGYAGVVNTKVVGTQAKSAASQIGHRMARMAHETGRFAWWEAAAAMPKTRRPRPGDLYVLHEKDNRATFSHIGYILKAPASTGGGTEKWVTVDGGQGMSKIKAEAFECRMREYFPATN